MNKTSIRLLVVLLALLGYTIKAEFDHRKEIDTKNAKIQTQQAQLQEWKKLRNKIDSLKNEYNLIWEELHAAKAAAFACEESNGSQKP
jgi:cell shape-determining protein MreC